MKIRYLLALLTLVILFPNTLNADCSQYKDSKECDAANGCTWVWGRVLPWGHCEDI